MLLAILVITLLAPGLAFLIYIVVQALLLGKANPPPPPRAEAPGLPAVHDDTTEHGERAEL